MTATIIAALACILLIVTCCNACRDKRVGDTLTVLGTIGIVAVVLL